MANKTVTLLQHNFDDGVQDLPVLSGNGSFGEPSGVLRFTVSAGQNADWWTSGRNGAAVYSGFGPVVGRFEKLIAECKFVSFSGNTYNEMYFNLYKGDLDWYQLFVDSGGVNLYARRMVGAGVTTYSSVAVPSYPFKVRMVWDVRNKTIEFQYDTIPTSGGWITLQSAVDIGSFVPTGIVFGGKNWSSLPALQCDWDDALVTGEYNEAQRLLDSNDLKGPAQLVDEIDLIDMGGPPAHWSDSVGVGQRVPGPVEQPVGSVGPFDVAAPSDRATPLQVGGPPNHSPSVLSLGQRLPGPVDAPAPDHYGPNILTGVSDRVFAKLYENLLRPGDAEHYAKPLNGGGISDEVTLRMGAVPEFNAYTPTVDGDGHVHLEGDLITNAFIYDSRSEVWNDPTNHPDFTGYGRDGTHYTNGVQDGGPVYAPWYSEAGGGGNTHRSTRGDFPLLALIICGRQEVVIYDLDNFPTTLDVWMRFQIAQSTSWYMMGRNHGPVRQAKMKNGALYWAARYTNTYSAVNGSFGAFDFKLDGNQDALWVVRQDWSGRFLAGKDSGDRNTTSWWESTGSMRLQNEYCSHLDVHVDPSDYRRVWCAIGGEDTHEIVELYDNVPTDHAPLSPYPTGRDNAGASDAYLGWRGVAFDESGQLYMYERISDEESIVWRNGFDYQGGVNPDPRSLDTGDLTRRRYPWTRIPAGANAMVVARQHILVATQRSTYAGNSGIWAIDRGSFAKKLAYTIAGGGGEGLAGIQGEILVGDKEEVLQLNAWHQQKTSYLMVATFVGGGGVTIIRLRDDQVMLGRTWNTLQEDGSYVATGIVV